MTTSRVYEIRVDGHLDEHWAARLGGALTVHNADGTTTVTVALEDAAAVHGVLTGLHDIGATLLSLGTPGRKVSGVRRWSCRSRRVGPGRPGR